MHSSMAKASFLNLIYWFIHLLLQQQIMIIILMIEK